LLADGGYRDTGIKQKERHGVGGHLAGDQDGVIGGRAARQVACYLAADLADLLGSAVERALVPGGRFRRCAAHRVS
jgi:hypothetical protein